MVKNKSLKKILPQSETTIKRQIMEYLELKGCLVFRLPAGIKSKKIRGCPLGSPDLMAITKTGAAIFIEVKTDKGKLSEVQKKMHEELENRMCQVIVARCLEDVREI